MSHVYLRLVNPLRKYLVNEAEISNELSKVKNQLEEFNNRISKARDKMLNDVIRDLSTVK